MHDRVSKSPGSVYSVAMLSLILFLVTPTLLRSRALAQNATGSINGTVTDPDDQVLIKAVVTLTNKTTGTVRNGTTGEEGNFAFESLPPGEYEVRIEAQGFKTEIQLIEVQVGKNSTANFALTIGAATEVVNVSGESSSILNTTDTAVGGVINRDRVDKLPLNGRSFLSIALLEPGVNVSYAATSGAGNPNNYFQVSIAGAPQSMTVISVDGSRVNDRVTGGTSQNFSAETVQEFQISTFGFDLSAGTVSAGAVNVVSRTGGNNFHGGGLFFFRDHNMAAFSGFRRPDDPTALNPLCLNPNSEACNRLRDPYFVRKQFGGTFGGPIKKDKLFFFGNYERNDQVGANSVTFSDPLVYGYNHVAQQPQKGHLGNYRMDYVINPHHNAFFRASLDSNNGVAGSGMESTWIASSNFAYQFQMGVTSVLKSNLVNDFRFSYSYFRNRLSPPSPEQCSQHQRRSAQLHRSRRPAHHLLWRPADRNEHQCFAGPASAYLPVDRQCQLDSRKPSPAFWRELGASEQPRNVESECPGLILGLQLLRLCWRQVPCSTTRFRRASRSVTRGRELLWQSCCSFQ